MIWEQISTHDSTLNSLSVTDYRMIGRTSSIFESARSFRAGTMAISSQSYGSSYQLRIGIPFSG
jgi:hypothetical protein